MKSALVVVILSAFSLAAAKGPVITSISPVQGVQGSTGVTISVNGSGFTNKSKFYLCSQCFDFMARPTKEVSSTQLLVTLQDSDLAQPAIWSPIVLNQQSRSTIFWWSVNDGTVQLSPGDVSTGLNGQIQFSASSTIAGDTIQWYLQQSYGLACPASIDQNGLFTAPSCFTRNGLDQVAVVAHSTVDQTKYAVVMVTIQ